MFKGNYIAGQFSRPVDPNGSFDDVSPANLKDVTGNVAFSYQDVDRAVDAARGAWASWKRTPLADRIALLTRYQEQIGKRAEDLAQAISRDMGKPVWESKTEVQVMVSKVEITIKDSMKFVEDYEIPNIMPATLGACRFRPLGVMAVIGPFNFPGHLPNGHIVPALITGNTVVFKPSEKTPLVGQIMAECFDAAGFPVGVFNLVQGEKEVGRRLCVHEGVAGVLFTGSYEVGVRIKQDTLQQHWKLLALEMGGKNSVIVWKDASMAVALRETLVGSFITTGQRCSCTSRILIHADLIDEFVAKFHEKSKKFVIGHPSENPFMGPLIDKTSVDRYTKFQGIALREGCEVVMRGKELETKYPGYYVTPSICVAKTQPPSLVKKSVYQQTELFAPNVAIVPFTDIEEAIELSNVSQFGLVSSVFSRERMIYEKCFEELEVGLLNWNKSTVGASSKLPFGGLKKSGNHFPTAVTATQYCTYPVASLETQFPTEENPTQPGLNWSS